PYESSPEIRAPKSTRFLRAKLYQTASIWSNRDFSLTAQSSSPPQKRMNSAHWWLPMTRFKASTRHRLSTRSKCSMCQLTQAPMMYRLHLEPLTADCFVLSTYPSPYIDI